MVTIKKTAKNLTVIYLSLMLLFTLCLTVAYIIPDHMIIDKWQASVEVIASETKRWMVVPGNEATKLDTFTDNLIFQRLTNDRFTNPIFSSLWIDGYYRYWMGIHTVIRPLLLVIDYSGMRYFNIFLLVGLFGLSFSSIKKYSGTWMAVLFSVCLGMIHAWIFPLSIQYSSVFVVMLFSILGLFYFYKRAKLEEYSIYIFFTIGAFTNYFDLLTAPLLTFGMPVVIYFFLMNKHTEQNLLLNIILFVKTGLGWLLGYSLTWVSKWVIGSILLRENIIKYALEQVLFRTSGSEEVPVDRLSTLNNLFDLMFPSYVLKVMIGLIILWLILFLLYKKSWKVVISVTPLLALSILPYVWFVVLGNHNQHHGYFTYRIQAISVFSVFTFMYMTINWNKVKTKLEIFKKFKSNQ